jgi:serine/threonine protein kinase
MEIFQRLSLVAVRQVIRGACEAAGMVGAEAVAGFLKDQFTDHSRRLSRALAEAHERAWKALEIALAGPSLWNWLDRSDDKAFRRQVRAFLDVTPLAGLPGHGPEFRQIALRELQAVRKSGVLTGSLDPAELARSAGAFARFSDPQAVLDAEWQAVEQTAGELRQAGYKNLAHLLSLRPGEGAPLLVVAVRYFFRRAVEGDAELHRGLSWASWENLAESQRQGFDDLTTVLNDHGRQLDDLLGLVGEIREAVLDIRSEVQGQREQIQHLAHDVLQVLVQRQLERRELQPGDSLSIRGDDERRLVKELVGRYRGLPEEQRRRLPALLNAVGKMEVVAGEFEAAQRDFQEAATLAVDRRARAEAHYNAYQAALERQQGAEALAELLRAAELDPERFAPFPLAKYEPRQILGAGGFGVAFLCRDRHADSRVVVKALRTDGLERSVADVFREARVLEQLDHPAIIRLRYCDYADAAQTRPYLVMDYFDGQTLADHVEKHGPLTPAELLALARPVAEALQAAHARGILHRDVKPANLLVRRDESGWRVKLIDFGLALKQSVIQATVTTPGLRGQSVISYSVAGTLDYAAPEQIGKLADVPIGPYSDVYGFGRTCCFALFRTAQPLPRHWRNLPAALAELLEECLEEQPGQRPATCAAILDRLRAEPPGQPPPLPSPPGRAERPPRPTPVEPVPVAPPPSPEPREKIDVEDRPLGRMVLGGILGGMLGAAVGINEAASGYPLPERNRELPYLPLWCVTAGIVAGLGATLIASRLGRRKYRGDSPLLYLARILLFASWVPLGIVVGGGSAALAWFVGVEWVRGWASMLLSLAVVGGMLGAFWGGAFGKCIQGAGAGALFLGVVAGCAALLGYPAAATIFGGVLGILCGALFWVPWLANAAAAQWGRPAVSPVRRSRRRRLLAHAAIILPCFVLFMVLGGAVNWPEPGEVRRFTGQPYTSQMLVARDGRRVLSNLTYGKVLLWDMETGRAAHPFEKYTTEQGNVISFSPDDVPYFTTVASDEQQGVVEVWNVETGERKVRFQAPSQLGQIDKVLLSRDLKHILIAAGSGQGQATLSLWQVDPAKEVKTFPTHPAHLTAMALSPDGNFVLAGSQDRTVRLLDVNDGRELHRSIKHTVEVGHLAFSPDGRYALSVARHSDGIVWVWRVKSWSNFEALKGHKGTVFNAAFSPDSRYILTGGEDGTMRFWDANTGRELHCFRKHRSWFGGPSSRIRSVAFSSDGEQALSASEDGVVRVWRLSERWPRHGEGWE